MNKHVVDYDATKPLHSSGFAKVASGDRIGSTDNTSFSQRQQIDQNRKFVQGYRNSMLGQKYGARGNSLKVDGREDRGGFDIPTRQNSHSFDAGSNTSQANKNTSGRTVGFVEPKARTYNPYA